MLIQWLEGWIKGFRFSRILRFDFFFGRKFVSEWISEDLEGKQGR